jgi:hypothetical protein
LGPGSTIQTRAIASQPDVYQSLLDHNIPLDFKMDIKPWINRPFYVTGISWTSTAPRFSILNPTVLVNLPRDVLNSNTSLTSICRLASLYRAKLCLNISLTGTISHQGMLLAAVLPPNFVNANYPASPRIINSMLTGPHAFLSANEASSVCIEVPWYVNTDLGVLDFNPSAPAAANPDFPNPNGNCATLTIMVLNPLVPSTNATMSVNVVIEAMFKELDLYVPSPRLGNFTVTPPTSYTGETLWSIASKATDQVFDLGKRTAGDAIDALRATFRSFTGLHNPNISKLETKSIMSLRNYLNVTDSGTCIEQLDPYSTVNRITDEPIFGTTKDEMTIRSITSKPQYLGTFSVSTTNNVGALCWSRPISPFQGGNGTGTFISNNIELLYQMTRAWKGSIKIHIQSVLSNKHSVKLKVVKLYSPPANVTTSYPTMFGIANAPSDLLEFSGGNQTLVSELPYLCRNRLCYCAKDTSVNSLFHGMYYIYVAQPLVAGDNSPLSVEFNVYMSLGDDSQFYGYSKDMAINYGFPTSPPSLTGESAQVMNLPSDQSSLLSHSSKVIDIDDSRLVPLVDIRPLIRRFQVGTGGTVAIVADSALNSVKISLASLICESFGSPRGSNGLIPAMYYGSNPGLKFKLKISGGTLNNVQFVAPSMFVNGSGISAAFYKTVPNFTNTYGYSDLTGSGLGTYPLPALEAPTYFYLGPSDPGMNEYEFSIPNTSILKFIGGPEKMGTGFNFEPVSPCSDLGNLVLNFSGTTGLDISYSLYYAYTDETRFGYHTIAPTFSMSFVLVGTGSGQPYYNTPDGIPTTTVGLPPMTLNSFLYYSNLTTSYS